MTIKKYSSEVDFCTSCNGKRIRFSRSYTINGILKLGYYETSDPAEQKVIESDYLYGTSIRLVEVRVTEDVKVEEKKEEDVPRAIVAEGVTTLDEASDYFVRNFGLEPSKVSTMAKVRNRMKEHNVEFPNLEK